jgi:hypothetical protein
VARILCALFLAALLPGADSAYDRAAQKIEMIEQDRAAPGSRIWLSLEELNAYGSRLVVESVPQGVRSTRLALAPGRAIGSALIDFLKVREVKGNPSNFLLAWILSGEKPVQAAARIESGNGQATVFVEQVTISGVTASGSTLDFLIQQFLLPAYPDAKIGRPIRLKHGVDRIEIGSAGVNVVLAGRPSTR